MVSSLYLLHDTVNNEDLQKQRRLPGMQRRTIILYSTTGDLRFTSISVQMEYIVKVSLLFVYCFFLATFIRSDPQNFALDEYELVQPAVRDETMWFSDE